MKKSIFILILLLLLTVIFDIGVLRSQEKASMLNSQYQSNYVQGNLENGDNDVVDDKNVGLRMLEASLKRHITMRYQKLYTQELVDKLESRMDR